MAVSIVTTLGAASGGDAGGTDDDTRGTSRDALRRQSRGDPHPRDRRRARGADPRADAAGDVGERRQLRPAPPVAARHDQRRDGRRRGGSRHRRHERGPGRQRAQGDGRPVRGRRRRGVVAAEELLPVSGTTPPSVGPANPYTTYDTASSPDGT